MLDWRASGGELHQIELPAFPGILLPVVFLRSEGLLYFPIPHVCRALNVRDQRQREKVKRDYGECLEDLAIPTDSKGDRITLCIEWEAFGGWIVSIQDERVGDNVRSQLRAFKRQVWRAASDILMGKHQPAALPAPERRRGELAGLRSLALQTEERVGRLEQVIFINEDLEGTQVGVLGRADPCPCCGRSNSERESRIAPCPYCGRTIRATGLVDVQLEPADTVPEFGEGD